MCSSIDSRLRSWKSQNNLRDKQNTLFGKKKGPVIPSWNPAHIYLGPKRRETVVCVHLENNDRSINALYVV